MRCMQATGASKVCLWKAIMVRLQPILLKRLDWKLLVQVSMKLFYLLGCPATVILKPHHHM